MEYRGMGWNIEKIALCGECLGSAKPGVLQRGFNVGAPRPGSVATTRARGPRQTCRGTGPWPVGTATRARSVVHGPLLPSHGPLRSPRLTPRHCTVPRKPRPVTFGSPPHSTPPDPTPFPRGSVGRRGRFSTHVRACAKTSAQKGIVAVGHGKIRAFERDANGRPQWPIGAAHKSRPSHCSERP